MTINLEIDPEDLDDSVAVPEVLEPEPEVAASQSMAVTLAAILPADFPLQTLLQFVPDVRLKKKATALADDLLKVRVAEGGEDGIVKADEAIAPVRSAIAEIQQRFKEPTSAAYALHRRMTGLAADFCDYAQKAIDLKNKEMGVERRRLDAAYEADRLARQEAANVEVREEARERLETAKEIGSPKSTIAALKKQVSSGVAAPVGVAAPPPLRNSSIVGTRKARFSAADPNADPHPKMSDLSPTLQAKARAYFKAVAEGRAPLASVSIEWSYLDKLAANDRATFAVPEMETFEDVGARSKPGRIGRRK